MKKGFFGFLILVFAFISIFLLLQVSAFAADPTKFTPIHEYNFDNDSGTTVLDAVASGGINGTCSRNNIKIENGSNYRSFNGTSDLIKFASPIIPTGKKTICFRIKVPSLPTISNRWIMHTLDGNSTLPNGTGIAIIGPVDNAVSNGVYGHLIVREAGGSIISPSSICDNKWHDIVYTYDGTTNENGMKLYVDGKLVVKGRNTRVSNTVDNNLEIGCHYAYNFHCLLGDLDNIKIYDKDISFNEPTNLRATGEDSKIILAWDPASDATSYAVKRSMTTGGPYTAQATVTSPSYIDKDVANGTSYYYVVTAVNSAGESKNSNEASATPQAPKPGTPANLTAAGGDSKISLAWNVADGAKSYIVKRSTTKGGSYTTLATVTSPSFIDNTVTNGTCYYYIVTAVNSAGESKNSNEASATPQAPKPGAITSLTATGGNSQVNLSWNKVDGATSYNIKRATTPGGEYTTLTTTSAAIYTDTEVVNGTTYYYVVSAVNAGGEGANSNEVSATPRSPAVTLELTSVDKAKLGDEITANVVIHNAEKICAEDIKIAFDTSKLEFVSAESADGIKIYKEADIATGIKRYIIASLGKANAANGDKILLKFKFKAIAKGEAKIDITKGRIADNATVEMDVEEKNCGEKTILIEGSKDVNRSGEYTLLDLGIDAWYYGDVASATDTSKYDADQDENGNIDDNDLTYIVNEMINNPNYFKMN